MSMVVDHTDAEEQHPRDDSMAKHLNGRACQCSHAECYITSTSRRRYAEQNDTHVAYAGIRNQPLHVLLHQADTGAIKDINSGNHR